MKENNTNPKTDRREFLGSLATSAAALGMTALAPISVTAAPDQGSELEAWFDVVDIVLPVDKARAQ